MSGAIQLILRKECEHLLAASGPHTIMLQGLSVLMLLPYIAILESVVLQLKSNDMQ
jgi:hypothetical protein